MKNFDCVIVGGGMVGAASALSLAQLGLKVAVVEVSHPKPFSPEQALDLRVSAISIASQHLLEQLEAWQQILNWRSCPYKRLGVWEQENAYTEFNAIDIDQPHLGHIVENRLLQLSLWEQIALQKNITLFCPEQLKSLTQTGEIVTCELTQQTITTKVVIAADGANSQVRNMVGIGITGWDYSQSAMLINVKTKLPQQDITWQQFHKTGPVAFLPLPNTKSNDEPGESDFAGNGSLVWYHKKEEIKRLSALSNEQLTKEIHQYFPDKLGTVNVLSKGSFPLTRRHANSYKKGRVLLLGDAAHTINPMAGQGVNLGFKDVKALQTIIATAISKGEQWDDEHVVARYEKMRRHDNLLMMTGMDALYNSFSHPSSAVKSLRNLSLQALNKVPFINSVVKNKALAYACGLKVL
jgi:2-octaprenyl-3-methyl-6-methoxy-1,4-benzoquinol hydroxylase